MPLTTSAARRNPMCIFGASPMIGRPLLLNRAAASTMPGSTSLMGLKNAASAAVSGLTSPSLSVSGRLGINPFLSLVGLPETDDPAFPPAKLIADHVKPSAHGRYGNVPDLAVVEAAVYRDNGLMPFDLARQIERQAALSGVFGAFLRVVLNLHIIL